MSKPEIARKMEKALRENLWLKSSLASKDVAADLSSKVISGVNVKRDRAYFAQTIEDDAPKNFLLKEEGNISRIIAGIFGTEIYRILSNKQFIVRRGKAAEIDGYRAYFGVKWREDLESFYSQDSYRDNKLFEEGIVDLKKEEWREFVEGYARLCRVMIILGESDYNMRNYLFYEDIDPKNPNKTRIRPVAIDRTALGSSFLDYEDESSQFYGSSNSRDFARIFLANLPEELCAKATAKLIREKGYVSRDSRTRRLTRHGILQIGAQIDPDAALLGAIKKNIELDPSLKGFFIEFMEGLEDAIELAKNERFLDEYCEKFAHFGARGVDLARSLKARLEQNAARAKDEFALFFEYKATLEREPKREDFENRDEVLKILVRSADARKIAQFLREGSPSDLGMAKALGASINKGFTEIARSFLIDDHINDYFEQSKQAFLNEASNKGNLKAAKTLVELGANPASQSGERGPINIAAEAGNLEVVKYLMPISNYQLGYPFLRDAIKAGENRLVKKLLQENLALDLLSIPSFKRSKRTLLFLALEQEPIDLELVEILLEKSDLSQAVNGVDIASASRNPMALHKIVEAFQKTFETQSIIKILRETLLILQGQDGSENSLANLEAQIAALEKLEERKPQSEETRVALAHLQALSSPTARAFSCGDLHYLKMLDFLASIPNKEEINQSETLMKYSKALVKEPALAKAILNMKGQTLLHIFCDDSNGLYSTPQRDLLVKLLLYKGVFKDILDKDGKNALYYAQRSGLDESVLSFLQPEPTRSFLPAEASAAKPKAKITEI